MIIHSIQMGVVRGIKKCPQKVIALPIDGSK